MQMGGGIENHDSIQSLILMVTNDFKIWNLTEYWKLYLQNYFLKANFQFRLQLYYNECLMHYLVSWLLVGVFEWKVQYYSSILILWRTWTIKIPKKKNYFNSIVSFFDFHFEFITQKHQFSNARENSFNREILNQRKKIKLRPVFSP